MLKNFEKVLVKYLGNFRRNLMGFRENFVKFQIFILGTLCGKSRVLFCELKTYPPLIKQDYLRTQEGVFLRNIYILTNWENYTSLQIVEIKSCELYVISYHSSCMLVRE